MTENVATPGMAHTTRFFSALDYSVFGVMLLISALIGVYFAFFAKQKQNTANEYLMGGKTMGIFPISMSLIASYVSGISLLGLPAEMYVYGTQYWMIVLSELAVSFTMAAAYIPVFYSLNITSSYEYLRMRFNQPVRMLGSTIFIIKMMLYIPLVIYVPALAFSQVTGVNLHLVTPVVCVVCIFYTTLGGLKAVVWTDTLQTIVMFIGVIIVMFLGTVRVGGLGAVFERNAQSGRLEFFNFDPNPTTRHTFWTVTAGNYFNWLAACSVNQAMVQRCLAMPTVGKAKITILILALGILGIVSMSCYTGLVIYAAFHDCDPVTTKLIKKSDQLLPYFVSQIADTVPGLPGLFVAGVFSAALSSMSTGLNSITGVLYEDFVKPLNRKRPLSEAHASLLMKVVVVIFGTICVGLVFMVEQMGAVIQAGKSLSGITAGALLGIFSMGMFFPWANSIGAMAGGISGMLLVGWISLGTQAHIAAGRIVFPKKAVSVSGCSYEQLSSLNVSSTSPALINLLDANTSDVLWVFRLSYLWYTGIGVLTTLIVGLAVSFATGANRIEDVDPRLISPVVRRFLPNLPRPRFRKGTSELNTVSDQKLRHIQEHELISTQEKLLS